MKVAVVLLIVTCLALGSLALKSESKSEQKLQPIDDFLDDVNEQLEQLMSDNARLWFQWTSNITDANAQVAIDSDLALGQFKVQACLNASLYDTSQATFDQQRMIELIVDRNDIPPLKDGSKQRELSQTIADMTGVYSTNQVFDPTTNTTVLLAGAETMMATSRDYVALAQVWYQWYTSMGIVEPDFAKMVDLSNEGARDIGFSDTGEMWKSQFDMSPEEFEVVIDDLWDDLKGMYEALHCHVRSVLNDTYSKQGYAIPEGAAIPAHILGNMWAQDWSNIYDMVVPYPNSPTINVDDKLAGWSSRKMVQTGENFFVSLGMDDLPHKFWENSQFDKPEDRDVVCHAEAVDVARGTSQSDEDVRLLMCIEKNLNDLITIHHELGHIYYFMQYRDLDQLYRDSANNGFHEAIGDTIALSITPEYLKTIGLLDKVSNDQKSQLNALMRKALEKIAFLPFGILIDKWRWNVFSDEYKEKNWNTAWWDLRLDYQGIQPPYERNNSYFDPAGKFHIVQDVPYIRYFLAAVLQFQFHKALCDIAGHTGPLYNCSIYGNKEAGARLQEMLQMGASRPWQDALFALTGSREMSAAPMIEYFQPLMDWIETQNKDRRCGWTEVAVDPEDEPGGYQWGLAVGLGAMGLIAFGALLGLAVYQLVSFLKRRRPFDKVVAEDDDSLDHNADVPVGVVRTYKLDTIEGERKSAQTISDDYDDVL